MNILILGAGQVGSSIAHFLNSEPSINLTVVDNDPQCIDKLKGQNLELKALVGNASYPNVLQQAGIEDVDIVLAVTGSDETNIVACQICYELFSTPKRIARVRADSYQDFKLFAEGHPTFAIDEVINPEAAVTEQFFQLIKNRGTSDILRFCQDIVEVITVKIAKDSSMLGKSIDWLQARIDVLQAEVVAIRHPHQDVPNFVSEIASSEELQLEDEVYFVSDSRNASRALFQALQYEQRHTLSTVIAGGGNIGERLAFKLKEMNRRNNVTVIELNPERSAYLEAHLPSCVVLDGDVTDKNMLETNYVDRADIFCAITDDDEVNVMSSLLAKQIGVPTVLTLIKKRDYLDIVSSTEIDVAISPQQSTASAIFKHVREVVPDEVRLLNESLSEIVEIIVKEGHEREIVGSTISDLPIPSSAQLIAITRGKNIILGKNLLNAIFSINDHLVFFISEGKDIEMVESLFKLKPFF